jgi:hypothetical protein
MVMQTMHRNSIIARLEGSLSTGATAEEEAGRSTGNFHYAPYLGLMLKSLVLCMMEQLRDKAPVEDAKEVQEGSAR